MGNQTAIAALVKFLQINQGDRICFDASQTLWQIDPGNAAALNSLVYIVETSANASLKREHLPQVVITLKDYMSKQFYKSNSYRYEAVFKIIWHCAENLTYPDFYKAMN